MRVKLDMVFQWMLLSLTKLFKKTATKNVEPIIPGNQAQSMPNPQQGLNMQNR